MVKRGWTRVTSWMVLMAVSVLVTLGSVRAADSVWQVWLYESETGRMTLVNETGTVLEDLTLPLVMNHDTYSYNVAVSHSGTLIAYTAYSSTMFTTQLLVYDTVTDTLKATYSPGRTMGDSISFIGETNSFSDFDTALAYGYTPEGESWRVVILDLLSNAEVFRLNATDPVATVLNIPKEFNWIPVVRRYKGVEVTFTMIPSGTEGLSEYPSYVWDPTQGKLRITNAYPTLQEDIFMPTGEIVFSFQDERLPNQLASLPMPYQNNTIQVFNPALGGRYPIHNDAARSFGPVFFIEDGQRLLTNSFDLFSEAQNWVIMGRDGTVQAQNLPLQDYSTSVAGLSDGFVYTTSSDLGGGSYQTALIHMQTAGNTNLGQIVWQSPPTPEKRIVWAKDSRTPDIVAQAATPWNKLADITLEPAFVGGVSPVAVPTATPIATNILVVGGSAIVNTTEGDPLNVRSGPGTSFSIVEKVLDGAQVKLLEGPRDAGGYTWWRVSTPSGNQGWVVQSADGIQVLIPSGNTASIVPIPTGLTVGGYGVVTQAGNNLNVRLSSNTGAPVVTILTVGTVVPIIGGPTASGGYTWWQVNTPEGIGWIAEGNGSEIWLAPR